MWISVRVAYEEADRVDEAIPLHEQILVDRQRALGGADLETVAARHRLASAYRAVDWGSQGDPMPSTYAR